MLRQDMEDAGMCFTATRCVHIQLLEEGFN